MPWTLIPAPAARGGGPAAAPTYPSTNGGMQLNASGAAYYTSSIPILNWWLVAGSVNLVSTLNGTVSGAAAWNAVGTASAGGGTAYFNPLTGELNNPCPSDVTSISRNWFTPTDSRVVFPVTPWWEGQTWFITWTGTSVPTKGYSTVASFTVTGPNSATMVFGSSPGNTEIVFPVTNYNDPPQNIKVYQSQYAANVAAGQFWNPDWLAHIAPFKTLRTMKWTGGDQQFQTDISQLAGASYNVFNGPFNSSAMEAAWPTPPAVGANADCGPQGGVHPSLICDLSNRTGINPWYCLPIAASNACMTAVAQYFRDHLNPNLIVTFQLGNENWNSNVLGPYAYCAAQTYPGTGGSSVYNWSGYRSAQLWQIAHDTFGANQRFRWRGCVDGQMVLPAIAEYNINGAQYWLANGAPANTQLTDLFDQIIVAGYFGSAPTSQNITAVTTGTTTTVTANNSYTVGEVIRLFFGITTAGTIGALLNNQDITVLTANSTSFTFTNYGGNNGTGAVNTTGLTYTFNYTITGVTTGTTTTVTAANNFVAGNVVLLFFGITTAGTVGALLNGKEVTIATANSTSFTFTNYGGANGTSTVNTTGLTYTESTDYAESIDYATPGLLFDLMDNSLTNFTANPTLYPTKYTYFAQQVFTAFTGTAANGYTQNFPYATTSMQGNALLAGANGLLCRQYEGGLSDLWSVVEYTGDRLNGSSEGNGGNVQFLDYAFNYKYDPGCAPQLLAAYAYNTAQWELAYSPDQSQFVEAGGAPNGWVPVRYFPGDDSNPLWQAILAQNALGPYSDPTPAPTGTINYIGLHTPSQGYLSTYSFSVNVGAGATYLVVGITANAAQTSNPTVVSVVDTTDSITLNQDILASDSRVGIYSGAIPTGATSRTITVTMNTNMFYNTAFVYTISNITTPAVLTTGSGAEGAVVAVTKGSFVIVVSLNTSAVPAGGFVGGYSTTVGSETVGGTALASGFGASGYFQPNYSSPIFGIFNTGNPSEVVVATYR